NNRMNKGVEKTYFVLLSGGSFQGNKEEAALASEMNLSVLSALYSPLKFQRLEGELSTLLPPSPFNKTVKIQSFAQLQSMDQFISNIKRYHQITLRHSIPLQEAEGLGQIRLKYQKEDSLSIAQAPLVMGQLDVYTVEFFLKLGT